MTKEVFDNYRFSVNTEVYLDGWIRVTEVDFEKGKIGVTRGYYLHYSEYGDIREKTKNVY